jgi:hypothetical protein
MNEEENIKAWFQKFTKRPEIENHCFLSSECATGS